MWISTPFSFLLFAIACMYSPAPLYNSPWTPIAASRKSLCYLPVGDLALLIRVDKVVSTPSGVWSPKWVCITKQRCEGQTPKERGAQSGIITV